MVRTTLCEAMDFLAHHRWVRAHLSSTGAARHDHKIRCADRDLFASLDRLDDAQIWELQRAEELNGFRMTFSQVHIMQRFKVSIDVAKVDDANTRD